MMKLTICLILITICLVPSVGADTIPPDGIVTRYQKYYPFISMTDSIYTFESEFIFPEGFHRPDSSQLTSFQNWIAHFPLWHRYKPVGIWKGDKAYEANEISRVVHIPWRGPIYKDVGFPLRMLAEYLHLHDRDYDLIVTPKDGDTLQYTTWLTSKVTRTGLGSLKLMPSEPRDSSVYEYFKFLSACMQNTNYSSLAANCDSISPDMIAPGDLLIGHDSRSLEGCVYVVMNLLINNDDEKLYVVSTGCPEACDFHIPLLTDERQNPWITLERMTSLAAEYPHWGFFRLHAEKR